MDCFNSDHLDASSSGSAASRGAVGGDEGAGGLGRDAVGVAAADVAHRRLDSLLRGVMKEREAWVLTRTMGLEGGEAVSTYALADELGMSRQGVDRLRNKALERLKRACQEDAVMARTLEEVCVELAGLQ
jgi:hypothetical protein